MSEPFAKPSSLAAFFRNHWAGLTTRLRSWYWRRTIGICAGDFIADGKILIKRAHNVSVGKDCTFAEGVYINARDRVSIGDHVRLSAYVRINSGALPLEAPMEQRALMHVEAPVSIGNYAWLATGVIVNAGVTIGEGVVVGSGAVVTKDLPPYTFCAGVPAKPIRELSRPASA